MMTGGLFMVGFGLIAMLFVIGVPALLIAFLVWASTHPGNSTRSVTVHNGKGSMSTCSHCGTDLQMAWSHCPHCGAQVWKRRRRMDTPFDFTHSYVFKLHTDWPVDIGIASGCILGYVFAWIGLVDYFHTSHWVAGVIGALAGYFVGWVWFKLIMKNGS